MRVPKHRPPTLPGQLLLNQFLKPLKITQAQAAKALGVEYKPFNEFINGKRDIDAGFALRLAKYTKMSVEFWLNAQQCTDLYAAQKEEKRALVKIKPIAAA